MNWVIPQKILAFSSPADFKKEIDPALTTKKCAKVFKKMGVGLVVRLSLADYDKARFLKAGIKHADVYFLDGTCPPDVLV